MRPKYHLAIFLIVVSNVCLLLPVLSQITPESTGLKKHAITTVHSAFINGQHFDYKATAGTLPVADENGNVKASLFYIYYKRNATKDIASRPITFCFNGGPGSSSVWLHMGFAGPVIVKLNEEGYPVFPFGLKNNEYSFLDESDIVFIDPVGTGYSRFKPVDSSYKSFITPAGDVQYLAEWIRDFLTIYKRWLSPKYLLGESYASVRVAGLSNTLQNLNVYLNGVVIISGSDLLEGIESSLPAAIKIAIQLPSLTKVAWLSHKLNDDLLQRDSSELMDEARRFTCMELIPAVLRRGVIDFQKKEAIAVKIANYTGLTVSEVLKSDLLIDSIKFFKQLGIQSAQYKLENNIPRLKGLSTDPLLALTSLSLAAQYHKLLSPELQALSTEVLEQRVEEFTIDELFPAFFHLMIFSREDARQQEIISKIAAFTGLPETGLQGHELTWYYRYFWEWVNSRGKQGIYRGFDMRFTNDEITFAMPFGAAINSYLSDSLHYEDNLPYMLSAAGPSWSGRLDAEDELRIAMKSNPYMQVMFMSGYYDFTCNHLMQKIGNMWQLDPFGTMKLRMRLKSYKAGHMMYIHKPDLIRASQDVREFILETMKPRTQLDIYSKEFKNFN